MNSRDRIFVSYLIVFSFMIGGFFKAIYAQDEGKDYRKAHELYKKGNYEESRNTFENLLQKNPSDTLAQKAHYFIGRILKENQRQPLTAIDKFYTVYSDYERSNLTDDSLYFLAEIYVNQLEQPEMALAYLRAVKQHFSETDYHGDAIKLLNQLKKQGYSPESRSVSLGNIPKPKMVLNFEKVDLKSFVKTYSSLTGKNFIFRPNVSGKITILGQEGIPVSDFHDIFLNILKTRGYTAIKKGNVYEVKPVKNALRDGVKIDNEQSGITTRFFQVGKLPVKELKNILKTVLPRRRNYQLIKDLNTLLISSQPSVLDEIERLIADLKKMNKINTNGSLISYTPKYLSPNELSNKVKPVLNDEMRGRRFRIIPITTSNKLFLAVPESFRKDVLKWLEKLDQDLSDDLTVKVFRLEHAEVNKIVNKVKNLLQVLPNSYTSSNVKVVPDRRQNAVVVSSVSETIFSTIKDLINELDKKDPQRPKNIRVFELNHANQDKVAKKIRNIVKVLPGDYSSQKVKILPDNRQKAIVVAAESRQVFPVIERVIGDLDKKKNNKPQRVRVYRLDHADEEEVAQVLNELIGVLPGEFPDSKIKIIPNERQRAVVVSAETTKVFSSVKKVIKQLDTESANRANSHHVYQVKHSSAGPLAEKLNFLFKGEEDDIRVTSDEQTNSLIISAPADEYSSIEQTIKRLDTPKSLIMVEAYIAEASQNLVQNLGIEWGVEGSVDDHDGNVGTNYGLRQQVRQGSLFGLTAGVFDDNSNNLVVALNALARDEDFKILSTANLVANENEQASLSVGQVIPLLKDSQVTEGGSINRSFTFEDVGVQLDLTPKLSGDSVVTLDIDQEISEVQSSGSQLGAPTRRNRSIQTSVAIPNQETLVLGGVLSDQTNKTDQQVPYLGDVPYLEHLFQRTNKDQQLRNLLIFLKPKILRSKKQLENYTDNLKKERNIELPDDQPRQIKPILVPETPEEALKKEKN